MTILSDNRFEPTIEPALLDQIATLSVEIADLRERLLEPEKARAEADSAAEEQRLTEQANARARDKIDDFVVIRDDLIQRVRRL